MINPFSFKKEEMSQQTPRRQYADSIGAKARILVGELVSPLPAPNQQLINELLDLITNTASMPFNLINKEAVLQNAKQLLIQLIEPIPEPNHALVNELVQLIAQTVLKDETKMQAMQPTQSQNPQQGGQPVAQQNPRVQQPGQTTAQPSQPQLDKGQPSLQPKPAAQQESISDEDRKRKTHEDKTVLNLILEQIKELILITNNLNDKLKKQESRIEGTEAVLNRMKEKVDTMDTKISTFEKNIEKFIGLYEVVTNQYNPFIEAPEDTPIKPEPIKPKLEEAPKKQYSFITRGGKEVHNLYELLDELIEMDSQTFIFHVGNGRNDFAEWVREVMKHRELADELSKLSTKSDMVKAITRKLN
jgi:archaellum component FlaC